MNKAAARYYRRRRRRRRQTSYHCHLRATAAAGWQSHRIAWAACCWRAVEQSKLQRQLMQMNTAKAAETTRANHLHNEMA